MVRRQPISPIRRSRYAAVWLVYLLGCGGIVLAGAMVSTTALRLSWQAPQPGPRPPEIPITRIQLFPDRNDLCRTLLFHNDSGRYQDGGTGRCTIPNDMIALTIRSGEEFAEAFRASWKGDSSASRPN
jgi:hypothetical protein